MAETKINPQPAPMNMEEIQARFSELAAEKSAIMDGYSLTKAQNQQLTQLCRQLQEQNAELVEERDKYKESHEMLERKTNPKPKRAKTNEGTKKK
jgi:predicted nuclease with TOPRIM domain